MLRITKKELVRRLEKAIRYPCGMEGLNTLIYGWLVQRKYGHKYRNKLYNRDWLFIVEATDLSQYAGVDLTQ